MQPGEGCLPLRVSPIVESQIWLRSRVGKYDLIALGSSLLAVQHPSIVLGGLEPPGCLRSLDWTAKSLAQPLCPERWSKRTLCGLGVLLETLPSTCVMCRALGRHHVHAAVV